MRSEARHDGTYTTPRLAGAAVGICLLFSLAGDAYSRPGGGGWQEVTWPFPRDGWPPGRAFHCGVASCGDEIDLYVRPKLGFCNCSTGVADDDEVDRDADLDLISERFVALEPGKAVRVAEMAGRVRAYLVRMGDGSQRPALGIAASRRCDLLVAAALGKGAASELQKEALDFLASDPAAKWINTSLTGRDGGAG